MRVPQLNLAAVFLILTAALIAQDPNSKDQSLEGLIARIPKVAQGSGHGVDNAEQALAKEIQLFGSRAVPRMIELLESKDDQVRFFAGYVLRDLDGVKEENLDALILAHKRGDGWIPPAIGKIGTPKAISYLITDIRLHPETQTQVTWALVKAGDRAAIPLAEIFKDTEPVSRKLLAVVMQVFNELGPKAAQSVPVLLKIAQDEKSDDQNRVSAIYALGSIGATAADAVPTLKQLAAADPKHFTEPVNAAIVKIGTPDAVAVFIPRLKSNPGVLVLRDLAELGKNGRTAGPAVVELLRHENWDIRVAAARTLGYIEYTDATDELKQMLSDQNDWRMVYVAAESLGRFKARSAVANLEVTSLQHWFPAVRNAALKAIRVIKGTENYESRWHRSNFPFEYFEYVNAGSNQEPVSDEPPKESPFPTFSPEPDVLTKSELKGIKYGIEIVGYDQSGRHATPQKETPCCGLRSGKNLLLGGNRGEWGGELVFMNDTGGVRTLINQNTEGIHKMPFGILATVGLAHMMLNSGYLYLVNFAADGKPVATPWKVLPGAPARSGMLKNGDLFVACYGGNIIITPKGEVHMARRVDADAPAK